MNDEIREILDNPKTLILSYGTYISLDDYFKLRDYITNLEQANERLRNHIQTIPYLQTVREKEDYKSRVEKASEDIKDIFKDEKWYENYEYNDLENALKNVLNILQKWK